MFIVITLTLVSAGAEAIVEKLNSDKDVGITDEDLMDREMYFGSNMREDLKAETCCSLLWSALDDLMLKLLIVCSNLCFSVVSGRGGPVISL